MTTRWKARAIYTAPRFTPRIGWTEADIDIVHDRQSYEGDNDTEFLQWITREALPALKKWATENQIAESSSAVFELLEGNRSLRATPNASYGYMYIEAKQEDGKP